jgi:G3E family GTPase
MLRHHFDIERLTVTVDALNGAAQLAAHPEAVKQVLVADQLVITKVDLVEPHERNELASQLAALNPAATIRSARDGVVDPSILYQPDRESSASPAHGQATSEVGGSPSVLSLSHTDDVRCLRVSADERVDWLGFAVWLSMLLQAWGEQVLRVKGLLELDDGALVSINGVQHVVHPPEHLDAERIPDGPPNLVFITRGLDTDRLRESLDAFQRAAHAMQGP